MKWPTPHGRCGGRRAAEADERLVDLVTVITGEKREHQPRRTFSDPRRARALLRCVVGPATALTAYDLDMADVRATFRQRRVPVEPRHFGERLVSAGFELNTAVRFPSADGLHQAFTVADQVTRGCDPLLKGGLKALKYAVAPTAFGVLNDVTAMLGEAEYRRHVDVLAKYIADLHSSTHPAENAPRVPEEELDPPELGEFVIQSRDFLPYRPTVDLGPLPEEPSLRGPGFSL